MLVCCLKEVCLFFIASSTFSKDLVIYWPFCCGGKTMLNVATFFVCVVGIDVGFFLIYFWLV